MAGLVQQCGRALLILHLLGCAGTNSQRVEGNVSGVWLLCRKALATTSLAFVGQVEGHSSVLWGVITAEDLSQ